MREYHPSSLVNLAVYLYLIGAGIGLIMITDPTNGGYGASRVAPIKYLPYLLPFLASVILILTLRIKYTVKDVSIVLFCLFMLIGSLRTVFSNGFNLEESFLGRSLGIGVVIATIYISRLQTRNDIFRTIFVFLAAANIYFFVNLLLYRLGFAYNGLPQMYQVQTALVASFGIASQVFLKRGVYKKLAAILVVLSLLMIVKTTAIISAVLFVGYYIYINSIELSTKLKGGLSRSQYSGYKGVNYFGVLIVLFISLYAVNSIFVDRTVDRARDHEVRAITIKSRYESFLQKPIYGAAYVGSPLVEIAHLKIPSHSDLVDILAMSGLLGIILFLWPVLFGAIKNVFVNDRVKLINWCAFSVLLFIFVMSVNPVMAVPGLAFFFWFFVALI